MLRAASWTHKRLLTYMQSLSSYPCDGGHLIRKVMHHLLLPLAEEINGSTLALEGIQVSVNSLTRVSMDNRFA